MTCHYEHYKVILGPRVCTDRCPVRKSQVEVPKKKKMTVRMTNTQIYNTQKNDSE